MRITIVGAGSVGTHLAKYLSGEHMAIFIIDKDSNKLAMLDAEYNLMAVLGDGTVFSTLKHAEVEKCDLFIAVTEVAERNLVACGIAKSMGAKITVARVDRYDYMEQHYQGVLHPMGVDKVIFPEFLISKSIIESLKHPWARNWYEFNYGEMIMVGVRLPAQSPLSGIYLRDLPIAQRFFHVVLVRRNFITLIPNGNCQLLPNDILYITIPALKQEEVAILAGKQPFEIKRVLITGGNKITEMTLNNAPKKFTFTVVENDLDRARALTRNCPNCDVIHGEPSEYEVLEEAGVRRADAFVALADTSEGNILTCLMARDLGVKKTIADVERQQFLSMAESFNIGAILNKKMLMANAVFQILIDAGSLSSKCLTLPGAEVIRLEIKKGSKITKAMVKDLHIPEEITFASLIRDGKSELVTGRTLFVPGDHILVVCLKGSLQKAKKLFDI